MTDGLTRDAQRPEGTGIELLYFSGCPTYREAERNLRKVLEGEGLGSDVSFVAVDTDDEARRLRFPGSPTIRVDGEDLFPDQAADRSDWALGCRIYATPRGPKGAPTPEMLRSALGRAFGGGTRPGRGATERRRNVTANKTGPGRRGPPPLRPPSGMPAARRLVWAVVGVVVYTLAYLAAKHFFGF